MSSDNLESKVKAAQEAVKNVDKDLRKTAIRNCLEAVARRSNSRNGKDSRENFEGKEAQGTVSDFECTNCTRLEGRTDGSTIERILPEEAAQDESGEGDRFRLLHQQAPGDL